LSIGFCKKDTKKQRTDELCLKEYGQPKGVSSKNEGVVRTEIDDDDDDYEMLVNQSQVQRLGAMKERTSKGIFQIEDREPRGKSSKREKAVIAEIGDDRRLVDQSQDKRSRLESSERIKKQRTNKDMVLLSEYRQPQGKIIERGKAVTREIPDVTTVNEESLSSRRSNQDLIKLENKRTFLNDHENQTRKRACTQFGHGTAMSQNDAEGIDVDVNEDQRVASRNPHEVYLKRESKDTLPDKEKQPLPDTGWKGGALTGNGEDGVIVDENQDPDQMLTSSHAREFCLNCDNKETLPDNQPQRLQAETNRDRGAVAGNDEDGVIVDKNQDPD